MTNFIYETVLSDLDAHGVRTITLNRPDCLNAMNPQLIADVAQAFEDANADPKTHAMIMTGAGKAFCAGDDRREHTHPETEDQARALVEAIQRCTRAITLGPKPVVGAINGWAVGGGFEWAINCDFPIWGDSAKGFFPEVSLNLFVTGAVTTLLPSMVGLHKAREMLYFGERYEAKTLGDLGVAWKVVPDADLTGAAQETARKLADLPPLSVRAMKRVLNFASVPDIHRALQLETDATVAGFMDPETTRRLNAF